MRQAGCQSVLCLGERWLRAAASRWEEIETWGPDRFSCMRGGLFVYVAMGLLPAAILQPAAADPYIVIPLVGRDSGKGDGIAMADLDLRFCRTARTAKVSSAMMHSQANASPIAA